ncbi:MAG: bifunctional NAD(P)/FAD-dependent oxidoreductase/class I SAM-dependent methyltransferase [Actinomycetota bacterium]
MSDRPSPTTRHCDVAVVGGSAAGLAAALQIQRQSRSVIVIDSGEPRNAPAAHMHAYLGYDGAAPTDLTGTGLEEVRRYGGEILAGRVTAVRREPDGFSVEAGNVTIRARRVVAATGVGDELPDIEGIADHWGDAVIHCPFCHGYEVRDRRLVQIVTQPIGLHPAQLFAHLSADLTLVVHPDLDVQPDELAAFERSGATVTRGAAVRILQDEAGTLTGIELSDGGALDADAVVVTTKMQPRVEPFSALGLALEAHPSGVADFVPTEQTGETAIGGLYAAGNLTDPSLQVLAAAAGGSHVGAMVTFDLAAEDLASGAQPSANETEWDARYSGDEVWSGAPNGTLVEEIEGDVPGRVLDVGAGEGGDALWLAERGWDVTATDVADSGLRRLAAKADAEGLAIRCVVADANALRAYGDDTYDLVSLFYCSIPRTGDERAVDSLLAAVAPGGTLLMVGHAPHAPETDHHDGHTRPWDRASFVDIDSVAAAVSSTPGWTVVTHELRDRPPGSSTHHHHDTDVVLRARRGED